MRWLRTAHNKRGQSRVLPALVMLLFVQGMLGTLLHFDVESHHFCVEHQTLTHDSDHAEHARDAAMQSTAEQPSESPDPPSDKNHHRPSNDCQWLTWLQQNSQASPDLAPQKLDLPPPAPALEATPPQSHQTLRRPVSIGYISPMNSPPVA